MDTFSKMYPAVPDKADQQTVSAKSYFRVTAQELINKPWTASMSEKESKGKWSPEVKAAEEIVASNRMDSALIMDNVFQRETVHKISNRYWRTCTTGNRMEKERKTNILFNNRIQLQTATAERRFLLAEQSLILWHQSQP